MKILAAGTTYSLLHYRNKSMMNNFANAATISFNGDDNISFSYFFVNSLKSGK